MKIESFYHQQTSSWSYVLSDDKTKKCAIIDPVLDYDHFLGKISCLSVQEIIKYITDNNLDVQWILETHIHADHLTASYYLKKKYPQAQTATSDQVTKIIKYWSSFFEENNIAEDGSQFDKLFFDREIFNIGEIEVEFISTPGHTPACGCYKAEDSIFVGDVIFMPDIGTARTDFVGGSANESYNSIQKIFSFGDNMKIYTAHDYPPSSREIACLSTVKEQKANNILANEKITREEFVNLRTKKDENKENPKLLFSSIQFNINAGKYNNEKRFFKLPISIED